MRLSYFATSVSLFLLLYLAPACAQENEEPGETVDSVDVKKVVMLTDSTDWEPGELTALKKQLFTEKDRVLVSGDEGETASTLLARLPWLLQPGVDVLYYDARLAGPSAVDSLEATLNKLGHPATVVILER